MTKHVVQFVNEDVAFEMEEFGDESILEMAERNGIDHPYQCRMGHCGMCAARIDGDVDQEDALMLTDEEKEDGYALTCVATPRSDLKVYSDDTP